MLFRSFIEALDRVSSAMLLLNRSLMRMDANLDAIVGALPDLATSIDTLVGELSQLNPSDPRAAEIVSQIQAMTLKVKQAAATIAPAAPVSPANPSSPAQTPTTASQPAGSAPASAQASTSAAPATASPAATTGSAGTDTPKL